MTNKNINKLQNIFDQANQIIQTKPFFPLLYEFVKTLLYTPEFKQPIIMTLAQEKKIDKSLEQKALNELKTVAKKLENYIQNISCSTKQSLIEELHSFESLLEKAEQLNYQLLIPLEKIFFHLLETTEHNDFVVTFGLVRRINDYQYIRTNEIFSAFFELERERMYMIQEKETAGWYSLNQLIIFYERYDARTYDYLTKTLPNIGVDITKLQEEHNIMLKYAYFNIIPPSNIFPLLDEYKQHMRRTIAVLNEHLDNSYENMTPSAKCIKAIENDKIEDFAEHFKAHMANIDYDAYPKDEGSFKAIVKTLIAGTSEDHTSKGRIDIYKETQNSHVLIELKYAKSAEKAIQQIHENVYYEKFMNSSKAIILIGISTNKNKRVGFVKERHEPPFKKLHQNLNENN